LAGAAQVINDPNNPVPSINTSHSAAASRSDGAGHQVITAHPSNAIPPINTSHLAAAAVATHSTTAARLINIQTTAAANPAISHNDDLIINAVIRLVQVMDQNPLFLRSLPLRSPPRDVISIIPNEVLLDIFEIVLSLNPKWLPAHTAPVRLSHVCVLWRALVLATPWLWTNIKITEEFHDPNKLDMTHFPSTLLRVEQYLERSRERPLTIDLTLKIPYLDIWNPADTSKLGIANRFFQTCVEQLSRLFTPHMWRFKSFKFFCNESDFMAIIQGHFSYVPMPMLESWEVQVLAFPHNNTETTRTSPMRMRTSKSDLCTVFPRLQMATFHCSLRPVSWSRFRPVHLRFLEFNGIAPRDGETMRQVLLSCRHSLESLILNAYASTTHAREPYEMSKLKRLELGYNRPEDIIPFISDIRLPQLDNLTIEDIGRRHFTGSPSAREVETARFLLNTIAEKFPLYRVEHLNLRQIILVHSPLSMGLVISTTLFKFLCKLLVLKSLTLSDPDIGILNVLNYIPVVPGDGGRAKVSPQVPVPALDVLRLEQFDRDWDRIQMFLNIRISRYDSLRRLNRLILSDVDRVGAKEKARSWTKDICRSLDMRLLTKNFEYVDPLAWSAFDTDYSFSDSFE
jgi:hypothetical protein